MLTTPQLMALCDILDMPWQPEVFKFVDADSLAVQKTEQQSSEWQAAAQLRSYLERYIYTDTDAEGVVVALITRWMTIGTSAYRIDAGGGGGLSGYSTDPEAERHQIVLKMSHAVPFYRKHDAIATSRSRELFVNIGR